MRIGGWGFSSGCPISLLRWFVCRRHTRFRLLIFSHGFLVLVFCVRVLLVRFTLVGLLFCIGRFLSVGLWCANLMGVLFWLSWLFVVLFFVLLVSMLLIVTLISLSVVLMLLTLLYLLFCAVTSTRSLIVLRIAVARVLLMFLMKVLLGCLVCFRIVVSWIFGVHCILVSLLLPGVGPMGPLLPALTSSVARMSGCLMCLLWTFYPAPSLIIVPFPFLGPFPTLCLWAQGCGS